jgi:hypothetical protein
MICEYSIRISCLVGEWCSGICYVEEVKAKRIDLFKKYLGPSFKEEWEGASTIISNQ